MGCDKNWLTKLIENELDDTVGDRRAWAELLADKLMRECDISPRLPGGIRAGQAVSPTSDR